MKRTQILTVLIALALIAAAAPANVIPISLTLTDDQGEGVGIGSVNGAVFRHGYTVIEDFRMNNSSYTDTFMTIQGGNDGIEIGYNTGAKPFPLDAKQGTTDLQLGDVSMRSWGGVDYFEFSLIINQTGSANQFLSVNEIKIYTSPIGSQNTTVLADLGTLHWSLDGDGNNNRVDIDYSLGSTGTNDIDMVSYIPVSLFDGVAETDFVYFYVEMGADQYPGGIAANDPAGPGSISFDGAEHWIRFTVDYDEVNVAPEPATMALLALGGIAMLRRRKR